MACIPPPGVLDLALPEQANAVAISANAAREEIFADSVWYPCLMSEIFQ
jgi:hypothetical protein